MAGIQKEFPYNYDIEASEDSINDLDIERFWEAVEHMISDNSDFKNVKADEDILSFTYKHDHNLKFDGELEASKREGVLHITGSLKRGLTGWGTCLICSTAGFASFMISQNYQKEKGEEIQQSLDDAIKKTEIELKDRDLLEKKAKNNQKSKTALEKLKEKFVEGEISEEEFKRKKDLLEE